MKPNTTIILMGILIAAGFAALLYFENQQTQMLANAVGGLAPNQGTTSTTTVAATPQLASTGQTGLPSQQILVLGGSIPSSTTPVTTTSK